MKFEQGNDIKISIGSITIGGQQGCSITRESDTTETTTKDSGDWSEAEVTGLSWSVDLDGLVVIGDEGLKALKKAWKSKELVDVKYGNTQDYETGKALIKSYSQNSPAKEKTTYSVSLQGVGELKDNKEEE